MSALLKEVPVFRPMRAEDLNAVIAIERVIYTHPWTRGNFSDSLKAGYSCWVFECAGSMVGYGVMLLAANEAHLLNLSVAGPWQRQGMGHKLLEHFIRLAKDYRGKMLYLEVRPSNAAALRLYESAGFTLVAMRRSYYPAGHGREDALLMGLPL